MARVHLIIAQLGASIVQTIQYNTWENTAWLKTGK